MAKTVDQNEKTGPEVEEQLADIAKQFLEKGMNKEALEKVLADILRPQNCDRLKVMRVNPSIFSSPVVCLCDTPGVVRRPSVVVRRLCRLYQLNYCRYERNNIVQMFLICLGCAS